MGKDSHIEWTDHTFNPWEGCTKVSPGCAHCYAEARNARFGGGTSPNWGKGAPRRRTSVHNWNEPRRWQQAFFEDLSTWGKGPVQPSRPRVFCASLADWLDDEVSIEWFADLLMLICSTPLLDWQLLTKRPQNWHDRAANALIHLKRCPLPESLDFGQAETARWLEAWTGGEPPANVWLGTSVENQQCADERIPALLDIPARVRFLSCEPLLGPVDLAQACGGAAVSARLDWVIVGGESGKGAREFCLEYAADLVAQCATAKVAVFVKQLGAFPITTNANLYDWPDDTTLEQHGASFAGARVITQHKKGGDSAEWPEQLQVRQFPGENIEISNAVSAANTQTEPSNGVAL